MNIAVVGTGMVGRLIAVELSRDHQVYAIDNNSENLILLNKYNSKIITNKIDFKACGCFNFGIVFGCI